MAAESAEAFLQDIVKEERLDEATLQSLYKLVATFGLLIVKRLGAIVAENRKEEYLMDLSSKVSELPGWEELMPRLLKEKKEDGKV